MGQAELFCSWTAGLGLPSSFYDLPVDIAATLIVLQNELSAEADDMASKDSVIQL